MRTYEPAQEEFVKHDGFSILLKAMQSNVEKLKVKASFLLTTMCSSNTKYKGESVHLSSTVDSLITV